MTYYSIKCLFVKLSSMCGLPVIMLRDLEPGGHMDVKWSQS